MAATCGSPPGPSGPSIGTPGRVGLTGELQAPPTGGQGQGSPPASPHAGFHQVTGASGSAGNSAVEAQDLQIEYWAMPLQGSHGPPGTGRSETVASGGPSGTCPGPGRKETLKTAFKSLAISRLPHTPGVTPSWSMTEPTPTMSLFYTKEKKKDKLLQKMGMKNKERGEGEQRSITVDGISRLICSSKHSTMRVWIDGMEWPNVKFFQLSSQGFVKNRVVAL